MTTTPTGFSVLDALVSRQTQPSQLIRSYATFVVPMVAFCWLFPPLSFLDLQLRGTYPALFRRAAESFYGFLLPPGALNGLVPESVKHIITEIETEIRSARASLWYVVPPVLQFFQPANYFRLFVDSLDLLSMGLFPYACLGPQGMFRLWLGGGLVAYLPESKALLRKVMLRKSSDAYPSHLGFGMGGGILALEGFTMMIYMHLLPSALKNKLGAQNSQEVTTCFTCVFLHMAVCFCKLHKSVQMISEYSSAVSMYYGDEDKYHVKDHAAGLLGFAVGALTGAGAIAWNVFNRST